MNLLRSVSVLALFAAALAARATFLVSPTGGTNLTGFTNGGFDDPDDGSLLRSLGGSFNLYGTPVSSLYVQTDGFLSTADGAGFLVDRSVGALAGVVGSPVIAPFYDDFYLDPTLNDTITEKVTSSYYSVTFAISGYSDVAIGEESNFQAALIKSATLLQGNVLLPGDIVLSYGALASTVQGDNFSVGVAASAANATNAFGATGGQFATEAGFLGNFNPTTQALLFRYNATTGTYAQSLITYQAVPEPSALAALGLGAVAVLRRRKRA